MKKSIFKWKMSAEMHKKSLYALRDEIIRHYNEQKDIELSLILDLLPLETSEPQLILDRGSISFNDNIFFNSGEESLVEFHDTVIGEYFVSIKEEWSGKLNISETKIEIEFKTPIDLEIPRLNKLGVNRSAFQKLVKIISSKETTLSILIDSSSKDRETWIDAVLDKDNYFDGHDFVDDVEDYQLFDTTEEICRDPNEENWYVYSKHGLCIVHYGQFLYGANGYVYKFGPAVKAMCDSYIESDPNCL